ncbi:PhzF family phenazine biosynthesis protein [Hydrogenophaga sp.]|uniref:PhzF family phenazine biosynthesis protein n=1 Tax=Hydrogenophaga sp. TaxID=1904254 RepID=UPI002FC83D7D
MREREHASSGPREVVGLNVFVNGHGGGNPVPLVRHATGMTLEDMQAVARKYGHESAFVFDSSEPGVDWTLRFFVPNHEMEMCGHATVGTLWAMRQWGEWTQNTARVRTRSGLVDIRWDLPRERVWISQPPVTLRPLTSSLDERVRQILDPGRFATWKHIAINASTSRAKTLIRVATVAELDALRPTLAQVEAVCADVDSTGLYPYAIETGPDGTTTVAARQFPRSSGYSEDAATGIAAAALWSYLSATGALALGMPSAPVITTIRQGEAMGCPSAIELQARFDAQGKPHGCWLSGQVTWSAL